MIENVVIIGLNTVLSLMLSAIAYFLHLMVQDIRDLKKEQAELRQLCMWLKADQEISGRYFEGNKRGKYKCQNQNG